MNKRNTLATSVGVLFVLTILAFFFVLSESLAPTREKYPPEIDINSIPLGSYRIFQWRDKPVAVFRPSSENLADLAIASARSIHHTGLPENSQVFVYYLVSTNHGCGLTHAPKHASPKAVAGDPFLWLGGFFDPCHYGEWDYAGRAISVYDFFNDLPDLSKPEYLISHNRVRLL